MTSEVAEALAKLAAQLDERRSQILHSMAAQARAAAAVVRGPKEKKAMLKTAKFMDAEADALAHMKKARKMKDEK